MQTPKLFFVPAYIGPLKYYIKLIPRLSLYYQIEFLIVRRPDSRRDQMEKYLKKNHYPYHLIEQGLKPIPWIYLPFLTPMFKRYLHLRACRQFLKIHQPTKLILTKNLPPYQTLLKEANRQEIDTIMLQWAYGGNKTVSKLNFVAPSRWRKFYYRLMDGLYWIVDFFGGGLAYANSSGVVNRLGLMDESAIEIFQERCKISPERMVKVGIIEQQISYELKQLVKQNFLFRKKLEQKYDLGKKEKIITVLVWGLHKRKRWSFSVEEHLNYFQKILESIRKFFPPETTEVVFKLHPGDNIALYLSFRNLSVKIVCDEAETEELVALSDLCVLDPWTAASITVLASGTPAIFVNFSRLTAINAGQELYHLKEVIISREQFETRLSDFKQGKWQSEELPPIDRQAIDRIVALINSSS
ncbi:MAG: hypothetical protein AAB677_01775 [Patescibacteria group bacterium]